jgi:selenocysteine lyase/cysteine desulfurase
VLKDRYGVVLVEAQIPVLDLASSEQIIEVFRKKITNKTKAILFSHITYKTGARLPAKAICKLARENGLISIVDGAHCTGMIELNFRDIGCDFYCASGHKWQCGPGEQAYSISETMEITSLCSGPITAVYINMLRNLFITIDLG